MTAPFVEVARRHEARAQQLAALSSSWTFDPVFGAASTSIERDDAAGVAKQLAAHFAVALDKKALRKATAGQRDVAMWAGGLEGKQQLWVDVEPGTVALFATIWPWTEDEGCTVRVGLYAPDGRAPDRDALGELVRIWFAVGS